MTLMDLKNFINSNILPSDFMIFINKDNKFLAEQYTEAIGKLANGGLNKISSIYEPQQSSLALLTNTDGVVNILKVETFDERAEDYNQFENTIVICEQIDKSIAKNVDNYVIKFPKLEEWQIFDYTKTLCPVLEDNDILWLIKAANNDISRVLNELAKITLFEKSEQKAIFSAIRFDPQTDLYTTDLFTIVNALVEGDRQVLYNFLCHANYNELEPVMLANRALMSLKNILFVSQGSTLTAEECGMSVKQYEFLKRKYTNLNIDAIKYKIKFLTTFDLDLKTSKLDISKRDMLNYLISHLTFKITM